MPRPFPPRGSHAGKPRGFPRGQEKTAATIAPFGVHILKAARKKGRPRRCARRIDGRRPFLLRPLSTQAPHGSLADRGWPPPLSRSSWVYVLRVAPFRPVTVGPPCS